MNTDSVLSKDDKEHFISSSPRSKIIDRLPYRRKFMARFIDGVWEGVHFKVVPINRKRRLSLPNLHGKFSTITFPYFIAQQVQFDIEIVRREDKAKPIIEMPLYEFRPEDREPRKIDLSDKIRDNGDRIEIRNELYINKAGIAFYSIEVQGSEKYVPIVMAEFWEEGEIAKNILYVAVGAILACLFSLPALIVSIIALKNSTP